jgi:natural product biosynthesis luciferase-like monooxygenase protein
VGGDGGSAWQERLAALDPERRRLLELRLERERARRAAERPAPVPSAAAAAAAAEPAGPPAKPLDFSLFFFSADGAAAAAGGRYRLLLDAARFADRTGFCAVWTPERHFVDFGGAYPNPSVLGAALATATDRLEIRAGSVVLPLHHPLRVAEEWAVVDNLSGGRAAISCASGWHPSDFCLAGGDDAARRRLYAGRKDEMFRRLDRVRRLWRGEPMRVVGGDGEEYEVEVRPRPLRRELPVWVTSAGSADTWRRAGEAGAGVLAAMGSQPPEDLARKVRLYREARRAAGHDPAAGRVSLMLHTYLAGDLETVKARSREPLSGYLRSYMRQRDSFMALPDNITEADLEALVPLAFEHYVAHASLLATPATARTMLHRLAALDVDEVACLVDFGLPAAQVMEGLVPLAEVAREQRREAEAAAAARQAEAVP